MDSGIDISVKLLQSENANEPIYSMPSGIKISSRFIQSAKAALPIDFRPFGKTIVF